MQGSRLLLDDDQKVRVAREEPAFYSPDSGARMTGEALQIRLLGELEVTLRGQRLTLPPSKKTRALLAYLALTDRPHRRERLCELLWDVTDDPRAALRWSLTKLRELVDGDGNKRLHADREHVRLDTSGMFLDVREVERLVGRGPEEIPTPLLEEARALFRGELLEGLALDEFHAYHAFCVAERRRLHDLHKRILHTLLDRAGTRPGQALALSRDLVQLDPLDEVARARLHGLLRASGLHQEAEDETRVTQRLFADERGGNAKASGGSSAGQVLRATEDQGGGAALDAGALAREQDSPSVGREAEVAELERWLLARTPTLQVILLEGEAGIGKTHLLSVVLARASAHGARVVETSAQELHPGWPFAPWIELLRDPNLELDAEARELLGPLWSSETSQVESQRERVFQAVTRVLAQNASVESPLVLAFEDAHWCDEASVSLLQHVIHTCRASALRIVLSGRVGEIADQPSLQRLLRDARRKGILSSLSLGPLGRDETCDLVSRIHASLTHGSVHVDHQLDPQLIYERSGGHPLFALELTRAVLSRQESQVPKSITQTVRDRVAALSSEAADVLRWAAVLGTSFELPVLENLLQSESWVSALEQLERHGLLRLVEAGAGAREQDRQQAVQRASFVHDIVRHAVYDALSQPRRRLMHQRVARLLDERFGATGTRASELAHHAALGGDAERAARACLAASRRCMRLFAEGDALALASRGLAYADTLDEPTCTQLSIELIEVGVMAGRPSQISELLVRLAKLTERALDLRELDHARRGFYVRAFAMWERGQTGDAQRFSREAERISRLGDPPARLDGLCEAAQCLVVLERELPAAEAFVLEAEALVARDGVVVTQRLPLARGTLCVYRGEYERARESLDTSRELARTNGDRLNEFYALSYATEGLLAQRRYADAAQLGTDLLALGERLREGSDGPYARALVELARHGAGAAANWDAFDAALSALARADAQQRNALVLARAADLAFARGELDRAQGHASEACAAARVIERPSEEVVASALLVRIALANGSPEQAQERAVFVRKALTGPLSAYAREAAEHALAAMAEASLRPGAEASAVAEKTGTRHEARHRRKNLS